MALGIGVAFCQANGAAVARLREPCVLKVSPESKRRVVECSVLLGSRQEERNPELESSRAALWSSRVATVLNQRFRERMEAREGIEMEGPLIRLAENSSTVEAAIVLVFGAGTCQCLDAICAKLRAVRAGGGIGFCIATKPFRFEGQRRLEKAERSLATLKAAADLLLVIDHETLLTRDGLTVMEATCLSNNMVSLGVQAVSQLISGQTSFFYDGTTEFSISEMILRLWSVANVRLGSGISPMEAVKEALDMVPMSEKERQGPIICAVANSKRVRKDEMRTAARILRSVSKTEATIACFSVLDTSLAPGTHHVLLMTTRMETGKDNLIGKVVYPSTRQDSRGHCQNAPTSSSTFTENFLAKNSSSTSRENTRANGTSVTETHIDSKAQRTFPTASTSDKECRSWESGPFSDNARAWAQSRSNEPRQPGRVREIRQAQAHSYVEPNEANKVNALQPLPCDPAAVPNTGVLKMGIDAVLEACRTASELIQDKDRNRPEQSLSERAA
ncbi:protein ACCUMULATION AND REPLICATION OF CHLOROPLASTS 3-like [Selaginella moellendorffii]|uniref:protein ACCUMULATION AND REPLICATION OF CHLOROPLASTS 3-like n=1 Tax=Selaginella moellendorffii TaxID=88036 RepID=UPI000D1CA529|nr:protein ACCUMULATION AND REPLICATION OF CHLOROPLASTS 3-like [Selaginella moellendorffii]|eukprot:XP_024525998.1 protein ACCUMULATION AND REPLICATION OF CHLOROPLASTS 3-like [Selaginella moellendorffii]